ncbi:hypothetical protein C8F04DRAFT_1104321 [Mycena alexandri]|uniref:Uncharacterized protein n=1 Tax=Mycena alexandri TaxID=1745969 RepID=A0AAD6X2S6_9AGAR|nr:hypothetical protein C8F04DRAFT_1104321 [Mycena alexandri]
MLTRVKNEVSKKVILSPSLMSGKVLAVNLAALTCSSLFYGMFLVLSSTSMYLLVGRYLANSRSRTTPQHSIFRSTVFIAAIGLFGAVTAHWITTVYRAFLAFIYFQNGEAAPQFYADAAQVTELVQEGFLMISILIGDSLIIHRLWVVWEHRLAVVVFPICSLMALTMCSAVSMYTVSRRAPGHDVFSDPWLTSNCVLTLVTNVYSTGFITFKIWNITRIARPIGGSNLRDFLVIVVESAAIYATWAIFFTATYQTRSVVQFLVIQAAPEVVGIVNALIHTRVGLGWAIEAQSNSPPASEMAFAKAAPTPRDTMEDGDSKMSGEFRRRIVSAEVDRVSQRSRDGRRPRVASIQESSVHQEELEKRMEEGEVYSQEVPIEC